MSLGFQRQSNNISNIVPLTFQHSLCIGATGCGKTTSFILPNINDRIKNGHSMIVFDYKGSEHSSIKHLANQAGRIDDVVHLSKEYQDEINLLTQCSSVYLINELPKLIGSDTGDNKFWAKTSLIKLLAFKDITDKAQRFADDYKEFSNVGSQFFKNYPHNFSTILSFVNEPLKGKDFLEKTEQVLDDINKNFLPIINKYCKKRGTSFTTYEVLFDLIKDDSQWMKLVKSYIVFNHSFKLNSNILEDYNRANTENGIRRLMNYSISLAPLISLIQPQLNGINTNLVKLTEENKIIIIDASTFDKTTLSLLLSSTLDILKTPSLARKHNISIFLDEAQRILTENMDLYTDVLRQAKVELFLSFQNHQLMSQSMGNQKYESILLNIKHHFYFRGFQDSEYPNFKDFEVCDNLELKDRTEFTPYFIKEIDKFDAEAMYQAKLLKLQPYRKENYIIESIDDESIIYLDKTGNQMNVTLPLTTSDLEDFEELMKNSGLYVDFSDIDLSDVLEAY
jgi:hypothetical protein